MFEVKVFGIAKGKQQARKLMTQIDSIGNKSIKEGAEIVLKETKSLVKRTRGAGIHHAGMPNRSSKPGQPVVNQSGELVKSLRKNRIKPKRWVVWSGVVQAWWAIGFGIASTRRPFFQIAARNMRKKVVANVVANYRKLLK